MAAYNTGAYIPVDEHIGLQDGRSNAGESVPTPRAEPQKLSAEAV